MKCEDCIVLLNEYADGELSPTVTAELEEHLSKCEKCRAYLDDICRIKLEIANMEEPVPSELHGKIMDAVEKERNKKIVKLPAFNSKIVGWAIAACFLVVVAGSFIPGLFSVNETSIGKMMEAAPRDSAACKDMTEDINSEIADAPTTAPGMPNESVPEEPGLAIPDDSDSINSADSENEFVNLVFTGNAKLPDTIDSYNTEYNGNEIYICFEYSDKAIDFANVLKDNGFVLDDKAELSKTGQKMLLKSQNVIVIVMQ